MSIWKKRRRPEGEIPRDDLEDFISDLSLDGRRYRR